MGFQKKFLFIDDDADDRDFFCSTMQMIEPTIECIFAKDGVDAMELLHENPVLVPDYIFIDMNMPRMDGVECLKELRAIDRLEDAKIYIYSTTVNPKINQEIMSLGAAGILLKPCTINELSSLLQQVIN